MNIAIKREQSQACLSYAERAQFGAKLKTKNIFKALALAMLLPAMLLTTACSKDDVAADNIENTANKGYTLPLTVNVTRQGGEATTRATYNETTKKLSFSTGDQLFVGGNYNTTGSFAGALTWVSGETFSGTITTNEGWDGTADALLTHAYSVHATLLPYGYENYDYFSISQNNGYNADYIPYVSKAFTTSKATAVEQFSEEYANSYSSGTGFVLSPQNAILNFTIFGLQSSIPVDVVLTQNGSLFDNTGSVTTTASGAATFAVAVNGNTDLKDLALTVDDKAITLGSTSTTLAAGHIYNITRSASSTVDLSTLTSGTTITLVDGSTLTGTLDGETQKVKVQIAAGATVTLDGVTINGKHYNDNDFLGAGINCLGDATIIVKGENTVKNFNRDYPAILAAHNATGQGDEYTLTIQGGSTDKLTTTSQNFGAAIGGGDEIACGNIVIKGCTVVANGGIGSAGIGGGVNAQCGSITIDGAQVTATAGNYGGAGIGGGIASEGNNASCGDITIRGEAQVNATGDSWGAGIGSGANATCGNITITGGTVTATGGNDAAGIGCGYGTKKAKSVCGNISIWVDNGFKSVTAIKGVGANKPIGMSKGKDSNTFGVISFNGEEINADDIYSYDPPEKDYQGLLFTISTTILGNEDESRYTNNTWKLETKNN